MATATQRRPTTAITAEPTSAKPVKAFAVIGALFIGLSVYLIASWIISGDAQTTPTGPTPVPHWMKISVHAWEAIGCLFFLTCMHRLVVRPWRREGRLSLDGMLCIACLSVMWQDTLLDYFQPWGTINAELINFGAWNPHIPGWVSPRSNLIAEPLLFDMPAYVWFIVPMAIGGSALIRKLRKRWPNASLLRVLLVVYVLFMLLDGVAEPLFLKFGLYSYPGSIQSVSIFAGRYYQFPIYEAIFYGATWTAFACLRHFRNDRGETIVERGIEALGVHARWRTPIRVLALAGACNLIFLLTYSLPASIMGIYADRWPDDVVNRSYLTNGLCGPGTPYACPGPDIPIPRPDSSHLGPDGRLVRGLP